ncbi:MAG: bifunctional metallophosphatase/5'-nucleotidase, partial [Bacteroidaceae bacterium]|nr:bifunctional metallophosphatase/5'-nucleotidase [Bacteroidaceae bacterium]
MMKSKLSLIILMLWCACIAVAQEKTLFLVHTNDTHSCVEPISPNHADSSLADKGGFVRRAALVSQLRRAH